MITAADFHRVRALLGEQAEDDIAWAEGLRPAIAIGLALQVPAHLHLQQRQANLDLEPRGMPEMHIPIGATLFGIAFRRHRQRHLQSGRPIGSLVQQTMHLGADLRRSVLLSSYHCVQPAVASSIKLVIDGPKARKNERAQIHIGAAELKWSDEDYRSLRDRIPTVFVRGKDKR